MPGKLPYPKGIRLDDGQVVTIVSTDISTRNTYWHVYAPVEGDVVDVMPPYIGSILRKRAKAPRVYVMFGPDGKRLRGQQTGHLRIACQILCARWLDQKEKEDA